MLTKKRRCFCLSTLESLNPAFSVPCSFVGVDFKFSLPICLYLLDDMILDYHLLEPGIVAFMSFMQSCEGLDGF